MYCVTITFRNILTFNGDFSEKPEVAGSQIWDVGVLTDLGDAMFCQKCLHESCRMGRCIVMMKMICSLGHCECDCYTILKLSQRCLTNWLNPWENDCSQMHSKVSSDWLPSYIMATQQVLEIFKMDRYFADSPCTSHRNAALVITASTLAKTLMYLLNTNLGQTFYTNLLGKTQDYPINSRD